jgi:hypothetical protein
VTDVEVVTAMVVTVNVAVALPAATVTDEGTVAAEVLLLLSVTTVPPVGAAVLSVTVPVALAPPVTDVGLRLTELRDTPGVIVRVAVFETLLYLAVMVTDRLVVVVRVVTVNVALELPAATVTDEGTVA